MERIPLLDLKAQYRSLKSQIDQAVLAVLESQRFILGPNVKAFEQEAEQFLGTRHVIACASGSDALELALRALGIGSKHEVVVPAFTFAASAMQVSRVGAEPVFADIEPDTFNLDPMRLSQHLTSRTKAMMPVHLFGCPVDMEPVLALAKQRELYIIEDAAQAIGATYHGAAVGTLGHIGCFSFYPSKNLGAYGDGGMLVTNDDVLADELRLLRNHGQTDRYTSETIGTNSRLDEIQAAVLRIKLQHLRAWTTARRSIARRYNELLRDVKDVRAPGELPHAEHVFYVYTIRVKNRRRDALRQYLDQRGIDTSVYYPVPLHLQRAYLYQERKRGDLPECEQACEEVLSLPIYPELTDAQVERIAGEITSFLGK
ncbi:MAG: DegT/DnrJ/EryC1/StrS family aminotransferase [Deinococcus sp.]|nr:DegT/DnrJ/EryC1/StrS family aminotransferase [Deinococcus sp.]